MPIPSRERRFLFLQSNEALEVIADQGALMVSKLEDLEYVEHDSAKDDTPDAVYCLSPPAHARDTLGQIQYSQVQ